MNVMFDRNFLGYSRAFINERDRHKAFVDDSIVVEVCPLKRTRSGSRLCTTLVKTIDLYCCTTTNDGAFFRATIVEQPD